MQFGRVGVRITQEPIIQFNKDAIIKEILETLDGTAWFALQNIGLCDILVIKNTIQHVEIKINEFSPQPYTKTERKLFQVVIAIDITDSQEPVTKERTQQLETFTTSHIICDSASGALRALERLRL